MEPILFLVHRIPYPPNKGDKIRSFNILRWLSLRFDVHLGCFIDDPDDRQYVAQLETYCSSYKVVRLDPTLSKFRSITALLTGAPLTLPYYASSELKDWVHGVMKEYKIKKSLVFSSSMAQYLENNSYAETLRVLDLVDVDSDKWRQYAKKNRWPMSWVYHREYKQLEAYEKKVTKLFDSISLVSPEEAVLFRSMLNGAQRDKVFAVTNGVDSDYFDADNNFEVIDLPTKLVSFTGAMDYWANIEAVVWFCRYVWPRVLKKCPDACFYIVGTNPSGEVLALHDEKNIVVTGRVPDVRPYIYSSLVVVAPLRIARGVQNKVLEALSMDKFVVGTTMAFEGIEYKKCDIQIALADDKEKFADDVIAKLTMVDNITEGKSKGRNRDFVVQHYNWDATLEGFAALLHADQS